MANKKKKQAAAESKKKVQTKDKQAQVEIEQKKIEKKEKIVQVKKNDSKSKIASTQRTSGKNDKNKKELKKSEVVINKTSQNNASQKAKKEEILIHKTHNKNKKESASVAVNSDEMGKLVRIILVLIVIVVAFYGLTVIITKFQKTSIPDRNKNIVPAVIQYDEILIGTILNQTRDEYYVLIQKDDDQYQTLTSYYLQRYNSNSKSLKVYISNINSVYNQFYISETSNIKTNNINEFRVSTITLIKVKNHEIVEAYEGLEEIENAFKKILDNKE